MIDSDNLLNLVKTYFSTVFFVWVAGNILLRLLITKKKKKKRKKSKKSKGKKGGDDDVLGFPLLAKAGNFFYYILCWIVFIFTFGSVDCWHGGDDAEMQVWMGVD
tara:strand:- start:365 stop:679 length:315 start_codon:yes stop_codon:yes gene_type:complete